MTSAKSVEESVLNLLNKAKAEDHELVTLIYGEGVSRGEADRIVDKVRENLPGARDRSTGRRAAELSIYYFDRVRKGNR